MRRQSTLPSAVTLLSAAIVASACMPYSPVTHPRSPVEVPAGFASSEGGETQGETETARRRWWLAFEDAALTELEERALSKNFGLRAAWARLSQAKAIAEQAGAPRWPTLGIEGSASRQRQIFGAFGAQEFSSFSLSAPVSYELDLFQRLGGEAAAADLDALSSRDDFEALAMSLSAQVAEAWYDLMESRARRALLERQRETNEMFLELAQLRFSQGLASAVDVYQQRQQVIATRAQLSLVTAQETVSSNQLGALLGEAPRGVRTEGAADLPDLPPLPAVGLPSTVLRARPDVRSAKRRVVSADYRVGAAIAEYFPRINLRGSLGFGAQAIRELFEDLVWSVVASISQTLWDGGRRGAEVDRRTAAVQERLEQYGEVVLRALIEVDNALVQERQQHVYIGELEEQVENASNTLREAQARYQEGLTDYLPVLSALSSHQQAELGLISAKRRLLSFRIQLHRALGGTWTHELALEERAVQEDEEESR